jgi:sterol desaturase/sphingolipid hydroxylase (fatty acid hydroxylase superfamily)
MCFELMAMDDAKRGPRMTFFVATAAFLALLAIERRRPLRKRREPEVRRVARNLGLGAVAAVVTAALEIPLLAPAARKIEERRLGLIHQLPLPRPVRVAAGVLLLDYTLWWWHWMNHTVPFLWRFHLVHHVDLDLDASTALRFHFGEMALSVLFRAAQFRILGIDPAAAALWQTALFVSILFHHSNTRLGDAVERRLSRLIVTPRMHGIHHSTVRGETDSNWSSLLSWWDFLHGTFRLDVPQDAIAIGVPAWQDPRELTLGRILAMPFRRQRDDWDTTARFREPSPPSPRA